MTLAQVLAALEGLAPLRLAGSWDNVGLLLEGDRPVRRLGLTIDLTEAVVDELLAADVDLVVAYHPPIFRGVQRLTRAEPRDRSLLRLIREGLHLYAPHSALDAAAGGMADWLLEPFDVVERRPIVSDAADPSVGAGRWARLRTPAPLSALRPAIARLWGLPALRVAGSDDLLIETVAVCPGAGGSLFERCQADLLVTGEMRHHDVLAQVERGGAVVLSEHTRSERGYLARWAGDLARVTGCPVHRSAVDDDPLRWA